MKMGRSSGIGPKEQPMSEPSIPSLPDGYEVTKRVDGARSDCHVTVGFDREGTHIPRFLVLLHYQVNTDPLRWDAIARMDHNETAALGHDIYQEGVHVDIAQRNGSTAHVEIFDGLLQLNRGVVIRKCVNYLKANAQYFIEVFEGDRTTGNPPKWPDGGKSPRTLISPNTVRTDMSHEQPAEERSEEILSDDELTEVLADATGTTPEEIEEGAEAMDWPAPEEATVIDE